MNIFSLTIVRHHSISLNTFWLIEYLYYVISDKYIRQNTAVKNIETQHNLNIHKNVNIYKHVCTHKNIDRYALLHWQAHVLVNIYMHVYEVTGTRSRHHRCRQATAPKRVLWEATDYIRLRHLPPAPKPSYTCWIRIIRLQSSYI